MLLDEFCRDVVVVLRIQQDGHAVPFDSDDVVRRLALRLADMAHVYGGAGKQQLPHASGIGHMADLYGSVDFYIGDKAVRPLHEIPDLNILRKFHVIPYLCYKNNVCIFILYHKKSARLSAEKI